MPPSCLHCLINSPFKWFLLSSVPQISRSDSSFPLASCSFWICTLPSDEMLPPPFSHDLRTVKTNESWRQDLTATKDFIYKLSSSKHLKNVARLLKHCCSVSTPITGVAGKAKFLLFSERCHWSCCRVGLDFVSYMENQGSQKVWGETGGWHVQWCSWLVRSSITAWP